MGASCLLHCRQISNIFELYLQDIRRTSLPSPIVTVEKVSRHWHILGEGGKITPAENHCFKHFVFKMYFKGWVGNWFYWKPNRDFLGIWMVCFNFRHTFFFHFTKDWNLAYVWENNWSSSIHCTKWLRNYFSSYCQSSLVRKLNVANFSESVWMFHVLLLCELKAENILTWLIYQVKYSIFTHILFQNNFYLELLKNNTISIHFNE